MQFIDTYERLGNALSPTAPFPRHKPRLILAGVLVPILLGSLVVSSYIILKAVGFLYGFIFFGDPIIQRALAFIDRFALDI